MSLSKKQTGDRIFLSFSLLILFLTSFPLSQGWIPLGDFRPRVLLLVVSIICCARCCCSKDLIWLYVYYVYRIIALLLGPGIDPIGELSLLMELIIPIIIANFVFNETERSAKTVAIFAIILTVITLLLTIRFLSYDHDIMRNMVVISAWGGIEEVRKYWRVGVCSYSFAQIMMCLPPVLFHRFLMTKRILLKVTFLVSSFFVLYFVYASQITTTFFLCVLMIILVLATQSMSMRNTMLWIIVVAFVGIISYDHILHFLADYFDIDTEIGAHAIGAYQFITEGGASSDAYDVDGRVDLYGLSLNVFYNNPIFGNTIDKIGGHNFLLDNLARYGIVGCIPLFLFFYHRFSTTIKNLDIKDKKIYAICIMGFVLLACIKNVVGIDNWMYMFLYIPCFLKMTESKVKNENRLPNIISR